MPETLTEPAPRPADAAPEGERGRFNYYDYFTEIEDYFLRRRGKTLLLSPVDWAQIEEWKRRGVPLHVVLRGIERTFDSYDKRPAKARRRTIKSLLYCAEEVEAQHAEWLESQTGRAAEATNQTGDPASATPDSASQPSAPAAQSDEASSAAFAPADVRAHLARRRESLARLRDHEAEGAAAQGGVSLSPLFREALGRAVAIIEEVAASWGDDARPSAELSESALTRAEKILDEHLPSCFTEAQLADERRDARAKLAAYEARMPPEVYQTTLAQLVLKRLRERAGVPRLSLFDL